MSQNLYKYSDSSITASIDLVDGLYEVSIDNVVQGLFKEMDDAAKYTSAEILKAMIEDVKSRDLVK
jgi:hypothetical protein